MTKISVRFDHGCSLFKIFNQPLYYLSENIRQQLYKINADKIDNADKTHTNIENNEYNISKLDTDLGEIIFNNSSSLGMAFDNVIHLEIIPTDDWKNINLSYILNKYKNNITFTYKGKQFDLKIIELKADNTIIKDIYRDTFTMYSVYEIIYDSQDIIIFEQFIKASINYFEKHYHTHDDTKDTINISITSQEGCYFQSLGRRNKRDIDSVYLPKKQKQDIINDLEKFLKPETKQRYAKLGINYKRIYLLEGIPGTGKTSLITGLASKFNFNIAIVSFIPKMTDVDLIRSLRTLRDNDDDDYKNNKKTFLVFEDIDCIFKERKSNDEHRNNITFSGLLNALDGITSNDIICFITTNYKCNLDSALLRPGRIDYMMRFDYAIKEQIMDIYKEFTSETNTDVILSFYNACHTLNIKITTALLQQYLMKYIDKPLEAIENVDEMKKMYDGANISKEAENTGLYG